MTMIESLRHEYAHEARTTRRHLERLPDDKMEWRPHPKSYTAGALASHIVGCFAWPESIFSADDFDFNPATFQRFQASSVADLLAGFDERVAASTKVLAAASEAAVDAPWRFKIMGKLRFEKKKGDAMRDFTLSHAIHHRGQMSVYLRLLDVSVPGSYGPTADEQ